MWWTNTEEHVHYVFDIMCFFILGVIYYIIMYFNECFSEFSLGRMILDVLTFTFGGNMTMEGFEVCSWIHWVEILFKNTEIELLRSYQLLVAPWRCQLRWRSLWSWLYIYIQYHLAGSVYSLFNFRNVFFVVWRGRSLKSFI